eukprot:TRINITY_DN1062_c0_g1_i1.p1 TRINITY_DN1062_c0_g1~~TRINITY_DN1062_c0_g1_i1.p1  ORF type:complete len:332 (+),score=56.35 TRINITY_DN1062_c0_g1_i1:111-1106(+)
MQPNNSRRPPTEQEQAARQTAPQQQRVPTARDMVIDLVSGGVSAAVSRLAVAPVERVRVVYQCQSDPHMRRALLAPHQQQQQDSSGWVSLLGCALHLVRSEGFFSLWRGVSVSVCRYFPTQALNFALRDTFKRMLSTQSGSYASKLIKNILSGAAAGAVSLAFVYPLDTLRTRLMCDVVDPHSLEQRHKYSGVWNCLTRTVHDDGFSALYSGFAVSVLGIVVYRAAYFGIYDSLSPLLSNSPSLNRSFLARYLMAQFVTILSGVLSYPLDTLRRRMMIGDYNGTWHALTTIVNNEGISSLFAGCQYSWMQAVIGAGVLVAYDTLAHYADIH